MNVFEHGSMQKTDLRQEGFFFLTAAAVLFIFLGHNALWGSEDRWAEIVREMLLTGDYLHPTMNWQVYFDKPLLSYWFILPFAKLLGATSELASRIPSALAALLALWSLQNLASELFSRRIALLSCWLLLGCYGFLFWGRTAAADMANLAAVTGAAAWFFHVEKRCGFGGYLVFWLICFAGSLTKGLPALIVPVALLFPYLIASGSWKKHLNYRCILAFLIGAALFFAAFYIPSVVPLVPPQMPASGEPLSGLELLWRENIVRALNAFDHKDRWYSYFYNLPRILLPGFLLIAAGMAGAIRNWRRMDLRARWLLIGCALVFLLFSLSSSRRWYYILPLAPFCALFGAAGMLDFSEKKWNSIAVNITYYAVLAAASLFIGSICAYPLWEKLLKTAPPAAAVIALPAAGMIVWVLMLLDFNKNNEVCRLSGLPHRVCSTVIGMVLLTATVIGIVIPAFTVFRTEKDFFQKCSKMLVARQIKPEQLIFYRQRVSAKYLYYNDLPVPVARFSTLKDARKKGFDEVAVLVENKHGNLQQLEKEAAALGVSFDPAKPLLKEISNPWENKKQKEKAAALFLIDLKNKEKKNE